MNANPIGIFDSGIGGLTVAKAVTTLLPGENIVYFGDTAHLPYGDKSTVAIQAYSIKIADFLLKNNCKVILIACNSASAAAYELVREYVGSRAKVLNVIDPIVEYAAENFKNRQIGLIGTVQTVNSNVYKQKIESLHLGITLKSLATRLLVPMIEEGFFDNNISESTIHTYLSDPVLEDINALILGCTHYPLIKKQIEAYYHQSVPVIDSSVMVAEKLNKLLIEAGIKNDKGGEVTRRFFISDYTRSFEESTRIFFGQSVHLEYYKLWE